MSFGGILSQYGSQESKKLAVWQKGAPISQNGQNYDPAVWRYDANRNVIKYSDHGDRNSKYGWEMDHYPIPAVLGGTDDISNLRPLHCVTNASHGGLLGAALNR